MGSGPSVKRDHLASRFSSQVVTFQQTNPPICSHSEGRKISRSAIRYMRQKHVTRSKPDPADEAILPEIGERLRAIRDLNGLSQEEISDLVKVSRKQWIAWEKGEVTLSAWAIRRLMLTLDIDPAWLLNGPGATPLELSNSQRQTRFGRVRAAILSYSRDIGLSLPPVVVSRFTMMVTRLPEESDKTSLRDIRGILRDLAGGVHTTDIGPDAL